MELHQHSKWNSSIIRGGLICCVASGGLTHWTTLPAPLFCLIEHKPWPLQLSDRCFPTPSLEKKKAQKWSVHCQLTDLLFCSASVFGVCLCLNLSFKWARDVVPLCANPFAKRKCWLSCKTQKKFHSVHFVKILGLWIEMKAILAESDKISHCFLKLKTLGKFCLL